MSKSTIEWTDTTWNPLTGCSKISPGCKNCYAESIAERFRGTAGFPEGFDVTLREDKLKIPLRWRSPQRVFVNSMSDLFHEEVPTGFISEVFDVMIEADRHLFQILTKRPAQAVAFLHRYVEDRKVSIPDNILIGVSVESSKYLERVTVLSKAPSCRKFVSFEPLLSPINPMDAFNALHPAGIEWIIIGGESGRGARPCMKAWVEQLIDAGRAVGCRVFVKQLGTWSAKVNGFKNYKGANPDEWPEHLFVRDPLPELMV